MFYTVNGATYLEAKRNSLLNPVFWRKWTTIPMKVKKILSFHFHYIKSINYYIVEPE